MYCHMREWDEGMTCLVCTVSTENDGLPKAPVFHSKSPQMVGIFAWERLWKGIMQNMEEFRKEVGNGRWILFWKAGVATVL